jgi:hypothetical protein
MSLEKFTSKYKILLIHHIISHQGIQFAHLWYSTTPDSRVLIPNSNAQSVELSTLGPPGRHLKSPVSGQAPVWYRSGPSQVLVCCELWCSYEFSDAASEVLLGVAVSSGAAMSFLVAMSSSVCELWCSYEFFWCGCELCAAK